MLKGDEQTAVTYLNAAVDENPEMYDKIRKELIFKLIFYKVEKPKISIIIPMYNEEKNILTVVRSIQNQSLQEIEIVCVNDNSQGLGFNNYPEGTITENILKDV